MSPLIPMLRIQPNHYESLHNTIKRSEKSEINTSGFFNSTLLLFINPVYVPTGDSQKHKLRELKRCAFSSSA